jgi:MSHA biogenesis protein MshL
VTPQITADGEILLQIHPVVSTVTTNTVTYQVDGTPNTLPLAESSVRESDSIVRTRSGQIVVIGGLMQQTIDRQHYKTPVLGDIPGIGRLFRSDQDQKNKIELVVLLRALVVGGSGMLADSKAAGKLPQ